jgi:hypothetical protein
MVEILGTTSSPSIKENSWIANAAARKMQVKSVAIVIGKTIHLCNTTREEFIKNERWLKHELCHIQQFKKHGGYFFLLKYLWESLKHGYYNNIYEQEARAAEFL